MPVALNSPGVYIEEIPSGVRTITGVATSIAAFVGRTRRGPMNEPLTISSFGDFERRFGGLHADYLLGYAVRDFFLNGGSQAIVTRVLHPNFATDAERDDAKNSLKAAKKVAAELQGTDVAAAKNAAETANNQIQGGGGTPAVKGAAQKVWDAVRAVFDAGGATVASLSAAANVEVQPFEQFPRRALLRVPTDEVVPHRKAPLLLTAIDEGSWGDRLRARVDYDGITDDVANRYAPLAKSDLFNLSVLDGTTGAVERFSNVTIKPNTSRSIDLVLKNESNLVRADLPLPTDRPVESDNLIEPLVKSEVDADSSVPNDKKAEKTDEQVAIVKRTIVPLSNNDTYRSVTVATEDQGNDGGPLKSTDISEGPGLEANKRGLYALDKVDLFNLLCLPADQRGADTDKDVYAKAMAYCQKRRAMLLVDSPYTWSSNPETAAKKAADNLNGLNLTGEAARNAAIFFPRVVQADPCRGGQTDTFVPCGIIAGIFARTDATRGVWKAPAGLDATLTGVQALSVNLNDAENGQLNPLGINCLRFFPVAGRVVWGARTLRGADQSADEYKYIPVRRLALFIEESLYRGTQWAVFEPNDEPLWAQLRLNIGSFMHDLFRQGAFQGKSPRDAYFVKCDRETTTPSDVNRGVVNVVVGFSPLKPAEFVVIKLQQIAGQLET